MAVFDINGIAFMSAYHINGNELSEAYEIDGTLIPFSDDYNHYDNEYQHSILIARNEWAEEYRADATVLPVVLHTDQHGYLNGANGRSLFEYLSLAVKWSECSALVNLGDVANYDVTAFQNMVSCLSPIPIEKQINIWGNHETWTPDWGSDTSVPTAENWAILQEYFDNSYYNGYHFMNGTKCSQYMIDSARGIKYVVIGGWDYDKTLGGHSHYVIDGDNMESIISMLSAVDNYDIVLLSHIQPFGGTNGGQLQADGETTWFIPPVDGSTETGTITTTIGPIVYVLDTKINQLINDRKNKRSGTVNDSYGVSHSYDFTNCTSDLICTFSGHQHGDRYNWQPVGDYTFPVIIWDALYYDNHPFYFVNVNRTDGVIHCWKVDDQANIYRYSIPLEYTV